MRLDDSMWALAERNQDFCRGRRVDASGAMRGNVEH
jgi:hypothetical protein